jgi:hypothetical protein
MSDTSDETAFEAPDEPEVSDGPTVEEAKAAAVPHEPMPDAADLPDDVHDGEITESEDDPTAIDEPVTEENA